jgi:hypothetical protein
MESKDIKKIFNEFAQSVNFQKAFGGWLKEGAESIIVLDLQKSNYGDYFELNIKIYVQGLFGKKYVINKELVKKDTGDIFIRQPNEYKEVFDFDKQIDDDLRKGKLEELFKKFIVPFTEKALTIKGIKELAQKEEIFLLPAVKEEIENL